MMKRNKEEKKKAIYLWMHIIAPSWVEKDEVTGGTLGRVSRQSGKGE